MVKRKRSERPLQESNDDRQPRTLNSPRQGLNNIEAFQREVEEHFKDVDRGKYEAFKNLIRALKHGSVGPPCVISQAKELFRGHMEMLKLFNEILLPDHKILFKEDVPEIQDLAKLYVAKVKARSSDSVYTTFMHILFLHDERALTEDEVDREMEVLFAQSCDLLEEYDCFRPDRAAPVVQSPLHPRHSALEVSELQREQQRERLQRMCEKIAKRKRKERGKGVVIERKQPPPPPKKVSLRLANAVSTLGNRRSARSSVQAHPRRPPRSVSATPATETQGRSRSRDLEYAEYDGRAMCTPSYLLLKPPMNGDGDGDGDGEGEGGKGNNDGSGEGEGEDEVSMFRSELAKSVLNEECELVRERDSAARVCNPHEEALFKCEENQYKRDMNCKKLQATTESFINYLLKLQESNHGELPPIEELLSIMHKRSIQQLYGHHAQAFMAILEESPTRALPVLINRLVLKLEELRSYKIKATPIWLQVYKNHFHLSLG